AALRARDRHSVERALLAHLCRCTGWRTIVEAAETYGLDRPARDLEAASARATLEGGTPQRVGGDIPLGAGGFADDCAPAGAFGGKVASVARAAARRLADEHGRAVRVVLSREDVVRLGPKRPPVAAGVRRDGRGVVRVVRTAGIGDAIRSFAPELEVEEADV